MAEPLPLPASTTTASPAATRELRCGSWRSTTARGLALCEDGRGRAQHRRDRPGRRSAGRPAARARRHRARAAGGGRVRYVDEFRDAELGRAVAGEILATVEPGRHYKVMEVCGGHTHSIYKYGVDDLLPENVELVHGPGCPVCVIPMGRVDDGIAIAHQPGVIFTCFGDMMRVPGSDGTLLDAKAAGRRRAHGLLAARRAAHRQGEPRPRGRVLRDRLRDDRPLDRAHAEARQGRRACANFSCVCNHVTIVPPLRALLESPDLRLDGFIGPGHVSTVVGARPFEFIPADYGRPRGRRGLRAARHPAGDPHDPASSSREGRCEVENQYKRVVPWEGNLRALEVMAEVFELRPHFEWRGLGLHLAERAEALRRLRRPRRGAALQRAGRARRRPQGVPVRRGAEGRDQAVGVQGVRHRLHARARDRHVHGLARGRLRRLLQLRPLRPGAGGRMSAAENTAVTGREQRILDIIETARGKRPQFKDAQITMAHGAGGKATQTLIEGLFVPAFGAESLGAAGRRRHRHDRRHRPRAHHRQLRGQADPLPGRLDRRAGRQRNRQRPRRLGRAPARAEPLPDPRRGTGRGRAARRGRGDRGRRPSGRGRDRRPATPRSSSAATPTRCTSARPALGRLDPRATPLAARAAPGRPRDRLRRRRRARHGDHAGPRRARPRRRDRVRHLLAVAGGRRAARRRRARRCAACATRPAAASPRC